MHLEVQVSPDIFLIVGWSPPIPHCCHVVGVYIPISKEQCQCKSDWFTMWPWSDQVSAITVMTQNGFESVDVVPEFPVLVGFKKKLW